MKRFKTVVLLLAITAVSAACNQGGSNADAGAKPAANGAAGESPTPPPVAAPAGPAVAFALVEPSSTGEVLTARCAIDKVNAVSAPAQTVVLETGREARFVGWVSDPEMSVPDRFTIMLSGSVSYGVTGVAGGTRPDVARVLRSDALRNAGFNVRATLDAVAPGDYVLVIEQDAGGRVARCMTTTRITVVKSPA